MNRSIVLLEIIFSIVLLSIIFLTTSKFLFTVNEKNKTDFTTNITKIEFETTRLFLIQKLEKDGNLNKLKLEDNKLLYDNNLLLKKVTQFEISSSNDIYTINICINLYNNICQTWIIK